MKTDNILLLVVLAFLILSTWNGYRKGFLKIALSMAAMVGTIIIVGILNPYVSRFLIEHTGLYETLHENTEEFVEEIFDKQINSVIQTRTDEIFAIDNLALPKSIREKLIADNNSVIYETLGVTDFKEYLSRYLALMILNVISFIGTLLIAGFIVKVIFVMADIIEKVPGIKGLNKTAGLVFGFLQGMIILWIGCLIVTAFGATKTGQEILAMIRGSVILSFIYNNNCLMLLVGNIIKLL